MADMSLNVCSFRWWVSYVRNEWCRAHGPSNNSSKNCEANKVKLAAVLFYNGKCHNLRVIGIKILHEEKKKMLVFLWSYEGLCERPGLPVRGLVSLWEAWPPCERPHLPVRGSAFLWGLGIPVRGQASLWEARPSYERPGLPVRGSASMWEARPPCERPCLLVRGPASLWEALPPCKRLGFPERGPVSLWEAQPPSKRPEIAENLSRPFCHNKYLRCFSVAKKVFVNTSEAKLDWKNVLQGYPGCYDSLGQCKNKGNRGFVCGS